MYFILYNIDMCWYES